MSARFCLPRFSSRRDLATNVGAFLAAEISPVISARFWPPRFSSRRDVATNLGGQKCAETSGEISPRSRRDENLGGQKRAEISKKFSQGLSCKLKSQDFSGFYFCSNSRSRGESDCFNFKLLFERQGVLDVRVHGRETNFGLKPFYTEIFERELQDI